MSNTFESTKSILAANVKRARRELSISQEELAFRAGIDRTYASQIERGVANPSLGIICSIGVVLGRSAEQLLANHK